MRRGPDGASSRARVRRCVVAALLVVALGTLAACGGGGASDEGAAALVESRQFSIKLPPGYKVVNGKVTAPKGAARSGASEAPGTPGAPTDSGIPLDDKQDPTTALFSALGKFRACLDDLGVKFIGAPNREDPNSPTNDPAYLEGLTTCAARSNIVQALQAQQSANDNLTSKQIEDRNKSYLKWRSCMTDRGWKVPQPTPDAQGRLWTSASSGGGGGIQGPPGKDLLSSSDLQECVAKSQPKSDAP